MNEIGSNLKHIREAFGFTADEMAKILDIARPTYTNYELGRNEPSVAVLKALSAHFGIKMDNIVDPALSGTDQIQILRDFARFKIGA